MLIYAHAASSLRAHSCTSYPMSIYMRVSLWILRLIKSPQTLSYRHHRHLAIDKLVTKQATTPRISVYYYKIYFGDDIGARMRWW